MFYNLKIMLRNLRRGGIYSAINIGGLAIGMAACAFIVLWVQDERSYDRFHKDADNIYTAISYFKIEGNEMRVPVTPGLFASTAKEDFAAVDDFCRVRSWGAGFLRNDDVKSSPISCYYADPNFFDFFNFPIVKGNMGNPLQNPTDVVISERLARELFSDEDPVGNVVLLDNGRGINVAAVMKDMPRNTYLQQVDLVSLYAIDTASYYNKVLNVWDGAEFQSFLRLKPKTDVTQLAEQITEKQPEGWSAFREFLLQPLVNMHLYTLEGEPAGMKTVRLFQWIALIILVIACINYVNLVTARASKRYGEIGLKKVIGAKKFQMFLQLTREAMILFVIAVFVALILNLLLSPVFNQLSGKDVVFGLFDVNVWVIYIAMLLVVVALAGLYPAYLVAAFKPINVVQTFKIKRGNNLFRRILVVMQFTASTALIVCVIALGLQMRYMRTMDMGYDRENVLICNLGNMAGHFDAVKAELEQQTSILGVTTTSENIMNVISAHAFENWEGKMSEGVLLYTQIRVDTSFMRMMRLTLVDGTNFTSTSEQQFILNESAVKMMGLTDPVGKWVRQNDWKIVGVVKDFNFKNLHQEIGPLAMVYLPDYFRQLYVRIQAGNAQQAIAAVEKVWKQYNSDYAFNYWFMDDTFNGMYSSEIRSNRLFGAFSIIAILISCLGLFGLVAFTAELKTKEIGIRKVLGASVSDIVSLLSKEFFILVGVAMLIAFPLSYYWLDKMLQDYAYRINISWWLFVVVGCMNLCVVLLTVGFQAFKAATENPVDAIKSE